MSDGSRPGGGFFTLLWPFAFQGIALLLLRHWRSPSPWADLDIFSGGYIALTLLLLTYETPFRRELFRSPEALREAAGLTYDPATAMWGVAFPLGELLVVLDYGHWHMTPGLRRPSLQIAGLALSLGATGLLAWADTRLAQHFRGDLQQRRLMTTGPFAVVRHPRYAGLLLARLGCALIFASVLGWTLLLAAIFTTRRRIRLEEIHLKEIFGPQYSDYAGRTASLVPWIH